jgi:hypothetical protein
MMKHMMGHMHAGMMKGMMECPMMKGMAGAPAEPKKPGTDEHSQHHPE